MYEGWVYRKTTEINLEHNHKISDFAMRTAHLNPFKDSERKNELTALSQGLLDFELLLEYFFNQISLQFNWTS